MKDQIEILKTLVIQELCPRIKTDYVLLDVPNHRNIGDNLIWEGELVFLRDHVKYKNIYSANIRNFQLNNVPETCTILFHGGGNFGDLYPKHNEFRNTIINKFPNNPIIIFPQTIFFNSKEKMIKDIEAINNHKNIVVCVRDHVSYDLLANQIEKSKILLLPDMAFFVDLKQMFAMTNNKTNRALIMNRTDNEGDITKEKLKQIQQQIKEEGFNIDTLDWPTFSSKKFIRYFINKKDGFNNRFSSFLQKTPLLKQLVSPEYGLNSKKSKDKYIRNGVNFLGSYDRVYTTRLHGLIMSILLDKEVFILDNSYGKSKAFYDAWLKDFKNVKFLPNIEK